MFHKKACSYLDYSAEINLVDEFKCSKKRSADNASELSSESFSEGESSKLTKLSGSLSKSTSIVSSKSSKASYSGMPKNIVMSDLSDSCCSHKSAIVSAKSMNASTPIAIVMHPSPPLNVPDPVFLSHPCPPVAHQLSNQEDENSSSSSSNDESNDESDSSCVSASKSSLALLRKKSEAAAKIKKKVWE